MVCNTIEGGWFCLVKDLIYHLLNGLCGGVSDCHWIEKNKDYRDIHTAPEFLLGGGMCQIIMLNIYIYIYIYIYIMIDFN